MALAAVSRQWQETKTSTLRSSFRTIVEQIEAMAPDLVSQLEEAARQAEIRQREWIAEEERRKQV